MSRHNNGSISVFRIQGVCILGYGTLLDVHNNLKSCFKSQGLQLTLLLFQVGVRCKQWQVLHLTVKLKMENIGSRIGKRSL